MLGVADLPEIFDELLALVVGGQGQESLAFLIRDDVDHVLVKPALVLFGELGFRRGGENRQGAKERENSERYAMHVAASIFVQMITDENGRSEDLPLSGYGSG